MRSLSYKDTDKTIEVEIYGLIFEIRDSIEDLDIKAITKQADNDDNIIINVINDILGQGAVDKINEKRKIDGYENMNLQTQIGILSFVVQTYTEEIIKPINKASNSIDEINYRKYNRNQRNRKHKDRYRRY